MAEASERAKRLLAKITAELTAWGEPAEPCWAWHDGGEERALAAIEEELSAGNATRRELDQRIEKQRIANQGLQRGYDVSSRRFDELLKGWATFCLEVFEAETLGRRLDRDAFVDEDVADLFRRHLNFPVLVCDRCHRRAPCSMYSTHNSWVTPKVCAWGCRPDREARGSTTMENLLGSAARAKPVHLGGDGTRPPGPEYHHAACPRAGGHPSCICHPAEKGSGLGARGSGEEYAGCHSGRDGECNWERCPQLRDGEPRSTGRHCPRDRGSGEEGGES